VPAITRPQLAVYAAAAVAVLLLGARYLSTSSAAGGRAAGQTPARAAPAKGASVRVEAAGSGVAVVQVVGAVRRPGVYRLRSGRRVDDAVHQAGGATRRADLAGVNLAAKVSDGQQIIVPAAGASGAPATGPAGSAGGTGAGTAPGQSLNLNTATTEQLDQLDGVGPATAQKIVAYRQAHGGFRSVSELDQVPGIGEKKLAALKDRVRV
jgi:competence protein ComEA